MVQQICTLQFKIRLTDEHSAVQVLGCVRVSAFLVREARRESPSWEMGRSGFGTDFADPPPTLNIRGTIGCVHSLGCTTLLFLLKTRSTQVALWLPCASFVCLCSSHRTTCIWMFDVQLEMSYMLLDRTTPTDDLNWDHVGSSNFVGCFCSNAQISLCRSQRILKLPNTLLFFLQKNEIGDMMCSGCGLLTNERVTSGYVLTKCSGHLDLNASSPFPPGLNFCAGESDQSRSRNVFPIQPPMHRSFEQYSELIEPSTGLNFVTFVTLEEFRQSTSQSDEVASFRQLRANFSLKSKI